MDLDMQYDESWTAEERRMFDEMVKEEMDKLEREVSKQAGVSLGGSSRLAGPAPAALPLSPSGAERGAYSKTGRDGQGAGIMVRGQEWSEAQRKVGAGRMEGLPLDLATANLGGRTPCRSSRFFSHSFCFILN